MFYLSYMTKEIQSGRNPDANIADIYRRISITIADIVDFAVIANQYRRKSAIFAMGVQSLSFE